MITSFRHKGLRRFYETGSTAGIIAAHAVKLNDILTALDLAAVPDDMNLPGFKLHPLKPVKDRFWSVWVNANWRVTFRFVPDGVELVNYEDYH